MPTYYEMLKVSPSSSTAEIQAAVDAQYDQWRQLVTSHNPAVAEEANRNLRTLETIRATLTDPSKRAVYDASLTVGGLTDPSALLTAQTAATPPAPRTGSAAAPANDRPIDAWICPTCGTASPRGARHCNRCSAQLGIDCPKCKKLTLKSTRFCAECGAELIPELKALLQTQIQTERKEIGDLEHVLTSLRPWLFGSVVLKRYHFRPSCSGALALIVVFALIMMLPLAFIPLVGKSNAWILLILEYLVALPAAIVATSAVIRRFTRRAILTEMQTHQLRLAELEGEVSAISAETPMPG